MLMAYTEEPPLLERVDRVRRVSLERKKCNLRSNISSQIICEARGLKFAEELLYHCITVSRTITVQCSAENQSNLWACVLVV